MSNAKSEDETNNESASTDSVPPSEEATSAAVPSAEVTSTVIAPVATEAVESKESPVVPVIEAAKAFRLGRFVIATTPKPVSAPKAEEMPKAESVTKPAKSPKAERAPKTPVKDGTVPPETPATVSTEAAKIRRKFITIAVAIVAVGGLLLFVNANKSKDLSTLTGKVALSASELHDLVVSKHITVYWAGPMDGAKYTLTANTPGIAVVKYLPGGVGLNDTKTLFRAIGTYAQKSAFTIARNSGASPGNVGFVNADGNAIFYSSSRPSNVYVGIKGHDIQVEVFDPVVDQALGLVLVRGQIRPIA